jgi:hypothetical protein
VVDSIRQRLELEHQVMVGKIERLPTHEVLAAWPRQLKTFHHCTRLKAGWIARRLDYLQAIQAGFRVQDPVASHPEMHPASKQEIIGWSDYYFAALQLLICDPTGGINGFDLVECKCKELGKPFPFSHPRELIAETVKFAFDGGFEDILDGNTPSMGDMRKVNRIESKILRKSDDSPEFKKLSQEYWEGCKNSQNWIRFLFWAVEKDACRKPIKRYWQDMLAAHKKVNAFYTSGVSQHNAALTSPEWRDGLPFDRESKSRQPLNFNY